MLGAVFGASWILVHFLEISFVHNMVCKFEIMEYTLFIFLEFFVCINICICLNI